MYRTRAELEQEVDAVKQIDICYIARNMGYTLKNQGRTYAAREDKGLTFFPQTNTFYHFYTGKGGSVIDFLMEEKDIAFPEAVRELSSILTGKTTYRENSLPVSHVNSLPEEKSKPDFILPPANDNYKRAFAYLNQTRRIDAGLISRLMHEKRIYEEKEHHNCVFLATDVNGMIRHAFVRGTITDKQYRGDIPGSDKDYGFSISGSDDVLVIFEAPIDLLSYATIYPYNKHHLLATGMLSERPIDKYIEEHQKIKKISIMLDNDKKGIEATNKFTAYYKDRYDLVPDILFSQIKKAGVKDVNEYLVKSKKMNEELTKKHEVKKHESVRRYS